MKTTGRSGLILATLSLFAFGAGWCSEARATDCSGTITAGGTAQTIVTVAGALHWLTIANIDAAAGSGEALGINLNGVAALGTPGTFPLAPPAANGSGMGSFTLTPSGFGAVTVSGVATTTGHKYSCVWW